MGDGPRRDAFGKVGSNLKVASGMLYFFSSRAPLLPTSDFLPIPRDPSLKSEVGSQALFSAHESTRIIPTHARDPLCDDEL